MRCSTSVRARAAVALFADLETPALKASFNTVAGLQAALVRLSVRRWDSLRTSDADDGRMPAGASRWYAMPGVHSWDVAANSQSPEARVSEGRSIGAGAATKVGGAQAGLLVVALFPAPPGAHAQVGYHQHQGGCDDVEQRDHEQQQMYLRADCSGSLRIRTEVEM